MSEPPTTPETATDRSPPDWLKPALAGIVIVALLGAWVVVEIRMTADARGAVHAYTALLEAANHGDLEGVKALCTESYLRDHPPRLAPKGGVAGLPRNIHKNFQVWRKGGAVLLCPTNRVGPVLRFLDTPDGWKFDGIVGLLRPGNLFVPTEAREPEHPEPDRPD